MRWSYHIATLFGIPVRAHISLVIFLGLMVLSGGGIQGLALMIAVFGSVLMHELGHALVARSKGLPIADISLYPFGGMAKMTRAPKTTGDEILVAAAGPVVSIILGLGFWGFSLATSSLQLWTLAKVNLILGGFNLLPALPMDGGRILRAILARKVGYYKATTTAAKTARWIAMGMAIVGAVWSFWLIVIAGFVLIMSMAEEGTARARQFMGDPGYDDASSPYGAPFDPFTSPMRGHSTKVPGSNWEVLDEDRPRPRAGRRVIIDRFGNKIIVDYNDSRG